MLHYVSLRVRDAASGSRIILNSEFLILNEEKTIIEFKIQHLKLIILYVFLRLKFSPSLSACNAQAGLILNPPKRSGGSIFQRSQSV